MAAKLDATTLLLCSCEGTMTLDAAGIATACGAGRAQAGTQLCRSELKGVLAAAGKAESLIVGCTQEAPTFEAALDEAGIGVPATFVNIRERAGWSREGAAAAPKMAALIAAAAERAEPPPVVTLESSGVLLVLGKDQVALDAAMKLEDRLDVTVLLASAEDLIPPRRWDVPVRKGKVRTAKGHLGAFELVIDGYAEPAPSSRTSYVFGPGRSGLTSTPDIVLDLTGGPALFPAADLRPGYVRADPADPVAVAAALFTAADLTGTFDKPRYVTFNEDLCAHSRSKKTGCTRCLDLCPTGAIAPAGDHVAIDPAVCAGCGQCAAACPTGAAEYAVPPAEILLAKLRAILTTYARAGGTRPVVLMHDEDHGAALIDAAARFSEGLPASVIPVEVNEVTQVGLEAIAAAFAHGAAGVVVLTRAKPKHDLLGLERTLALAEVALSALGYGAGGARLLSTDDPDAMLAALAAPSATVFATEPSSFAARGPKRSVLNLAMRELHRVAPTPVDVVPLPAGAPFGTLNIDVNGCTLCLSCVSACPTKALGDDPDRPMLTFKEDACVQCGLCAATCPEKVISLEPRLNFLAFNAPPQVVKTEEPFACIACGKLFGTRSTIEKIAEKLAGKHWMYSGEMSRRIDLVRMCDTCRIEAVTNAGFDPYAAPRPAPRTTEDYLREREAEGEQKH
jgi:ferredoxin